LKAPRFTPCHLPPAADLQSRYARHTTRRPLLSLVALGALPLVGELICRLLSAF
jgi:hypothetical protein